MNEWKDANGKCCYRTWNCRQEDRFGQNTLVYLKSSKATAVVYFNKKPQLGHTYNVDYSFSSFDITIL